MQTLKVAALASAETLVNQALRFDPASRGALQNLAGKVLHVAIDSPPFDVYLCPRDDRLDLQTACAIAVTCKVSGSLKDMAGLLGGEAFSLAGSGVTVTGQTSLLLSLRAIFSQLDIDWEDWLASYVGDELANPIARGARAFAQYISLQARDIKSHVEPYLSEELALIPTRTAVRDFASEVDALALATDRIDAQIQVFLRKMDPKNPPAH